MPSSRTPGAQPKAPRPARKETCRTKPLVVGLTGGVAAGKSTVAAIFARLGARIIDADAIAHRVLDSHEMRDRLRGEFGDEALNDEGRPDRKKIGEIVFGDPDALRRLTALVHPLTIEEMRSQLRAAVRDKAPLVVIDAPLLIEADLDDWCDRILFVETDPERRTARAAGSRDWADDELHRREQSQKSLDEKRKLADAVIDNNGPREETLAQVERLYREWAAPPSHK